MDNTAALMRLFFPIDDAPSTTVRLQQQMDTSRILTELVALAEGRSTLVETAEKSA